MSSSLASPHEIANEVPVNAVKNTVKSNWELLLIVALIAVCLVLGAITVTHYGESWDEPAIYQYATYSLDAYRFILRPAELPAFSNNLNLYGPAYFMAAGLFERAMALLHPAWSTVADWHFFYYLTFLAFVLLLYVFTRRWLSGAAALAVLCLFISQPLFWGHAFINPKDLPFMAFFLVSVYFGLEMVDRSRPGALRLPWVLGAGLVLGLTVSFRSVGPLAGLIVLVYAASRLRRRCIPVLALYLLVAAVVTYLTWPYLWAAPLSRFLESLQTMSKFPFQTRVLFQGQYYPADQLPWFFYPVMLGIQLTEPLILLALLGLGIAARNVVSRAEGMRGPLLLFLGWFLAPVVALIALHSTLYDNGRQLFFLLPPILLLAGLALESLFRLLPSRWLAAAAVAVLVLPGLYASVRLHPYEYIYYNSLAGGTGAAYKQYEMDYWGTSYAEAAAWLNDHAAAGSTVWVTGPAQLLHTYLRPDLQLSCESEIDCGRHYDYVVTLARWKAEQRCRGAETVFSVDREGALFSVVKQLAPGKQCR